MRVMQAREVMPNFELNANSTLLDHSNKDLKTLNVILTLTIL